MSSMFGGSWATPPAASVPGTAAIPIETKGRNWFTRISAAWLRASSGVIVPSVSISIVSLS
jgi:hypothetical protein